jgi:hypothetical protein
MEREEGENKKLVKLDGVNLSKKLKRLEKPLIGSSSTWYDEQLKLFNIELWGVSHRYYD